MTTTDIFSTNLSMELKLRHISQSELARKLEIKQQSVNDWCTGKCLPSLENFHELCQILHASADILLNLDETRFEIPWNMHVNTSEKEI